MDDGEATEPPDSPVRSRRPGRPPGPPSRRRLATRLILLAVIAVAVGVAALGGRKSSPRPSPRSKPPSGSEQFGANTGRLFNGGRFPVAEIDAQLRALHDAGATLARSDASWEATEPQPPSGNVHHYDWSFDDLIAGTLAANDLTWLPVIDYSPSWTRSIPGQDHSPPDASEYAAYAAALAARYGPGGTFWPAHPDLAARPVDTYEIWNEPDNPLFWVPKPDSLAYANLYLRAREAIDLVQPAAHVIVGGLTHPAVFLSALMAAAPALRSRLDGVGVHPYGATPQAVLANVVAARSALVSLGLARVPLYVTEFGWTTRPPTATDYVSERLRPGYIEQTLGELGHTNCDLATALVYAWVTPERNPADPQDWFGISAPGGGTTPDTSAFSLGVRSASAADTTTSPCPTG